MLVLRSVYPFTGTLKAYHDKSPYLVAFIIPLGWTVQTITIWMVVMIALDHYIIVSQPLKSNLICTPKNAKKCVVLVAIVAVLYNAPRWPHSFQVAFPAEKPNSTAIFVSHNEFNNNLWDPVLYQKVYHASLTMIFPFITPISLLIMFNTKLIMTLKKAQRMRASMTQHPANQSKSSANVNLMMVIIITTFFICEFPDFIASIIGAGEFKVDATAYAYYAGIGNALLTLNSSINFYLYCLFYKRFIKTLGHIFKGTVPKDEHSQANDTVTSNVLNLDLLLTIENTLKISITKMGSWSNNCWLAPTSADFFTSHSQECCILYFLKICYF